MNQQVANNQLENLHQAAIAFHLRLSVSIQLKRLLSIVSLNSFFSGFTHKQGFVDGTVVVRSHPEGPWSFDSLVLNLVFSESYCWGEGNWNPIETRYHWSQREWKWKVAQRPQDNQSQCQSLQDQTQGASIMAIQDCVFAFRFRTICDKPRRKMVTLQRICHPMHRQWGRVSWKLLIFFLIHPLSLFHEL